ncbi:P pilus assembly chaperone PapD [Croceifilum oryzae]|uniref:P pilus assembly chaperone PapD n=1 Tax=Croceifilum oryzae TaxID=1553429 RepID=A0AAJ1TII5_9BACL|nr:hypothetical protein [Croceifilum oryzae]MDQ0416614.1 P pilus assembly chaperone PapD [Croceifilum oryzae]
MKMKIASLVSTAVVALSTSVVFAHAEPSQEVNLSELQSSATSNYVTVKNQNRQLTVVINNKSQGHEAIRYNVIKADGSVVANGLIAPNGNKTFSKYFEKGEYSLELICQTKVGCNATGSIGYFGD